MKSFRIVFKIGSNIYIIIQDRYQIEFYEFLSSRQNLFDTKNRFAEIYNYMINNNVHLILYHAYKQY